MHHNRHPPGTVRLEYFISDVAWAVLWMFCACICVGNRMLSPTFIDRTRLTIPDGRAEAGRPGDVRGGMGMPFSIINNVPSPSQQMQNVAKIPTVG